MTNTIKHQGIVESTDGSSIQVRIVQTSACAACSIKGHCTSAEVKEKLIEIANTEGTDYKPGDQVWVLGEVSMGARAVLLAFIVPFVVLVVSLFVLMALCKHELYAALGSLSLLIPYYYILWLNRWHIKKKFSFTIRPLD